MNEDTPKIVRWVMRHSLGLIRTETLAKYVLLGITVLAFLIAVYFVFGRGGAVGLSSPDLKEINPAAISR